MTSTRYSESPIFLAVFWCCVGVALIFPLYAVYVYTKATRELRESNAAAMADPALRERMTEAGYRIEERGGRDATWIVARCARANEKGPIPCDPAPRPQGMAGEAMDVIP